MTITFTATSKENLLIHSLDEEKFVPLQDSADLMGRWIPFQASVREELTTPNLVCFPGSLLVDEQGTTSALPTFSGLIGTILTAYNLHQNIVLRPDDIWITILGGFSAYVNGRAEELRSKVVSHDGQINLRVTAVGRVCNAPCAEMTRAFLDEIAENINDPTLKEWFLPGFSTSSAQDEVVAAASAMCAFQAYFTYTFGLVCGIPQITLLGSPQDWQDLRNKVERLVEFDGEDKLLSEKWVPLLRTVLDNFVDSSVNGSANNLEFWNQIVQYYYQDNICALETHLTGWLSTFTFFDVRGQQGVITHHATTWPKIQLNSISHNVASCPVNIDDNGTKYNATLFVGQMAFDYVPEDTEFSDFPNPVKTPLNQEATIHNLVPRNSWAIAIEQRDGSESRVSRGTDAVERRLLDDRCPIDTFLSGGSSPLDPTASPTTMAPPTVAPVSTGGPTFETSLVSPTVAPPMVAPSTMTPSSSPTMSPPTSSAGMDFLSSPLLLVLVLLFALGGVRS